jgi:hypothetical protein
VNDRAAAIAIMAPDMNVRVSSTGHVKGTMSGIMTTNVSVYMSLSEFLT